MHGRIAIKIRHAVVIPAIFFLVGCAEQPSDYDLNWDKHCATLQIYAPSGKKLPLLSGQLLEVPGYMVSQGVLRLHPGKTHIGYSCPRTDGVGILDVLPGIWFNFKEDHAYELKCDKGVVEISEIPP